MYFEIGCRDRAAGAAFYAELFDWDVHDGGDSSAFTTNAGRGIDGHLAALGHEPHAYTIFYVEVEDLDATIARAVDARRLDAGRARRHPRRHLRLAAGPPGQHRGGDPARAGPAERR